MENIASVKKMIHAIIVNLDEKLAVRMEVEGG